MARDFVTLGSQPRVWELTRKVPGHEIFGYFDIQHFDLERWKNEYSNPAFSRMTERDAAWMARILVRFTPTMVRALAELGRFADPGNTDYLEQVLDGRLAKILERYLIRLSPVADLHLEAGDQLCGVDLAEWRGLRDAAAFAYRARLVAGRWLTVHRRPGGELCVDLPHTMLDGALPDDSPARYVRVRIEDGVAPGPLVAHLYDLGPARGFFIAGIDRPER